jgi:hypothetical protein
VFHVKSFGGCRPEPSAASYASIALDINGIRKIFFLKSFSGMMAKSLDGRLIMRRVLLSSVAVTAVLWAASANAVPIANGSELSINGSDTFTSTQITFTGLGNVGGSTGDFTAVANCTACVTMIGSIAAGTTGTLYNAVSGAVSSALALNNDEVITFTPGPIPAQDALEITGSGTLTLTGKDPTPGVYTLTTQGPQQAAVTFSATSVAQASEPASLGIFGVALLMMGWLYQRRRQS